MAENFTPTVTISLKEYTKLKGDILILEKKLKSNEQILNLPEVRDALAKPENN